MDFTNRKKRIAEATTQQNPRIKSIKLAGSRLATRIARQAKSAKSLEELSKLSIAQSTITTAMAIVMDDYQRANRLLDMARSIANGNVKDDKDGQQTSRN
jgi:hypothetical protein